MTTPPGWQRVYLRLDGEPEHEIGRIGTRCALANLLHQSGRYLDELHPRDHDCQQAYQATRNGKDHP